MRSFARVWALGLTCCGATEGPLLVRVDAGGGDAGMLSGSDAGPAAGGRVRRGMTLQYQLVDEIDLSVNAELFVIDLFAATREQVAALHTSGRVVIAYLSAGSLESWRPDADSFPRNVVGTPLSAYPDEAWLDIRSSKVRSLMEARLELARDKGFDGVLPVALGAYRENTSFPLSESDQLDYDRFLFLQARARGLTPGLSDEPALTSQLADAVDWAVAFDCLAEEDCALFDPLISAGKPLFDIETAGRAADVCALATARGLPTLLKRPSFDAWRTQCP